MSKIAEAEGSLQEARAAIGRAEGTWREAKQDEIKKTIEDFKGWRDGGVEAREAYVQGAKGIKKTLAKEAFDEREADIFECIQGGYAKDGKTMPEDTYRATADNQRDKLPYWTQCAAMVKDGSYDKERTKVLSDTGKFVTEQNNKAWDNYKFHLKVRKHLRVNVGVLQGQLDEYSDWFANMKKEHACLVDPNYCESPKEQAAQLSHLQLMAARNKHIQDICR